MTKWINLTGGWVTEFGRTPRFDPFDLYHNDGMGIVMLGWKMAWSRRSLLKFLGKKWNSKIIRLWNPIACMFFGHSYLCQSQPGMLPVCCDCKRPVMPDNWDHVIKEYDL